MFPYNPFDDDHHHHHHMIIKRSSSSTTSSSDHQNPNLLPFPSSSSPPTFFDVVDQQQISPLSQILLVHNQMITPKPEQEKHVQPAKAINTRRNLGPIPRRRPGKKDRHSKICTAQGIRDRRMRLSLQIARKFFDLQDALGYDKASKTIEWLFAKSKKAIRQLAKDHPQYDDHSSGSSSCGDDAKSESLVVVSDDCEVVSGILNIGDNNNPSEEREGAKRECKPSSRSEMREKARARARFRTRAKMMAKLGFLSDGCTVYEGVEQCSNLINNVNQEKVVSLYDSLEQQFGDVGTIEKLLGNSSIVTCPNYSDYYQRSVVSGYMDPNNSFMGNFFGNWDVLNGVERTNSTPYGDDANQVSLGENPSSIYSATP